MATKVFKITKKEARKISLKDKEEMDIFWRNHCINVKDSITLVVKCHLFIENIMEDLLSLVLPKPEIYLKYSKFSQKVNLLESFRFFPNPNILGNIRAVNTLRNNLVHNLDKSISLKDINKITKGLKACAKCSVDKRLQASLRYIIAYLHASRTIEKLFPFGIAFRRNADLFKKDRGFSFCEGMLLGLYPYKEMRKVLRNLKL